MEERELESDSTYYYPTLADDDNNGDNDELESGRTRYLFPASEFEADDAAPGTSSNPRNGELVRNLIVKDMMSIILNRAVPSTASSPRDPAVRYKNNNINVLSRDQIIRQAMEAAYIARQPRKSRHSLPTQTKFDPLDFRVPINLNRNRKIPPIKVIEDSDIEQLIRKGKLEGYSEAAILKTRRDNNVRRLMIPNTDEAQTVDLWRKEEKYRESITKLQGYTL